MVCPLQTRSDIKLIHKEKLLLPSAKKLGTGKTENEH